MYLGLLADLSLGCKFCINIDPKFPILPWSLKGWKTNVPWIAVGRGHWISHDLTVFQGSEAVAMQPQLWTTLLW